MRVINFKSFCHKKTRIYPILCALASCLTLVGGMQQYYYDANGRLAGVTGDTNASYTYDAHGNITVCPFVNNISDAGMKPPFANLRQYSPGSADASYRSTFVPLEVLAATNSFLESLNKRDLEALKKISACESDFLLLKKQLEEYELQHEDNNIAPFVVFQALIVNQEELNVYWIQLAFQISNQNGFERNVQIFKIVNRNGNWKISVQK